MQNGGRRSSSSEPAPADRRDRKAYALYQDPGHTTLWESTTVGGSGSKQHFAVYAAQKSQGTYVDIAVATVAF